MALNITSTSLTATAGQPVMIPLAATGGTGLVTWQSREHDTALPPGMTLNGRGTLEGAPSARGVFSFRVRAFDSATPYPNAADGNIALTVS